MSRNLKQGEEWSTPQAARVAGITPRQAKYWDATGIVHPSAGQGGALGTFRLYTFRDLLALRAVSRLLETGISLQSVRKVQAALRTFTGAEARLEGVRLAVSLGKRPDVAVLEPDDDHAALSLLRNPGQRAALFLFELGPVYRDVRTGIQREARKASKQRKGIKQADAKVAAA